MPPETENRIEFMLGQMDSKLDDLVSRAKEDRESNEKRYESHDTRISKLESWRWRIVGALAALSALGAGVAKALS